MNEQDSLLSTEAPAPEEALVLGVRFRRYGPVFFFLAGSEPVTSGAVVLADIGQGAAPAEVISARRLPLPLPLMSMPEGEPVEIRPINGLAGLEQAASARDSAALAEEARAFCRQRARALKLDMKIVDVEALPDRSKIVFYFTAPNRIDFRDLVKELVHHYHARIELRQIGVRHETQMLGSLGGCGMTCCCRRYLRRFAPVTIKMAKEQNLFLNPAKLSGICGRLLCCLAHEQENYEEFNRASPKLGKRYQTSQGVLKVTRTNIFRQSITAVNEAGEEQEFSLENWRALAPARLEIRTEGAPHKQAGAKTKPRPQAPPQADHKRDQDKA